MFVYWGILFSFVGVIIALLIFIIWKRKAIWNKLSQSTKKKILSFKDSLIWSAPIRTILEIYYPTLLAALLSF
jgi:cell division protein FtsX